MRATLWTIPSAVAVLCAFAEPAYSQATANAVLSAEDAFGSSEGDETVGIYDESSVRGFNLEAAGNYRINGRYFVKNSGVSSFFLERTTVRIGYNTLSLDYPGPSGVVDYKLRDPARGEPSQVTLGLDSYEQPFADVHIKHRNRAETIAVSVGASSTFNWANEQGGDGRDALLAGTVRMGMDDGVRVQLFGGEYRYERAGRFRVALAPDSTSLPGEIERGRYLGQSWATEEGARRIFGGLADFSLGNDWSARAIAVFSQEAPDSKFTQLFSVNGADRRAESSYIVSPEQRSSSYSSELRLGRTVLIGQVAHSASVSARWRASKNRFGGEQSIYTGATLLGEAPSPIAFQRSVSEALLRDRIDQWGLGASYQINVGNRFRVNSGIQYADYAKQFSTGAQEETANQTARWLYNLGGSASLAKGIEVYGSYSRGLEEAGAAPTTASNANTVLEATLATQKELGLRVLLDPGVTLILAGFDTRKPQAGIDSRTGAYGFLGDVRHRGLETSISGSLSANVSAVLGAVYTDAEVSGSNVDAGLIGARPVNVPSWRAIANFNYAATPQLSFDLGVEYQGDRAALSSRNGETGSQLLLADATVVDLGLRYRINAYQHPLVVRAQILNALNDFSWRSAPGETLEYAPQRSFRMLATMDF